VISEAFTDQTSLDNWSKMLDEWMKSHDAFSRIQQLPGNPDWHRVYHYGSWPPCIVTAEKHHLNAEQMADYATSSLMYGFVHADPADNRRRIGRRSWDH
jgi:hypothetical protein